MTPGHAWQKLDGPYYPGPTREEIPGIIEKLRAETARGIADPVLHKRFLDIGIELMSSATSEEFAAFLRKQTSEFAVLAREARDVLRKKQSPPPLP